MVRLWTWGIRNPLLLVALVAIGAGAAEIVPWGLSLTTASLAGVMASLANRLARRARGRRLRAEETRRALDEATKLRGRSSKGDASRRAA